ncbi:hypothetical protein [Streptomyces sp. NPDC007264]|uniref:hypothetical protein n=1 Tax=Streptomyces sp. NPDC007264 TaxID=3364777 RepID=UPI0036DCB8AD
MKAHRELARRTLGCLAAALTSIALLVLPTATTAHAASPCTSDNPPDWCFEEPGDWMYDPTGTLSSAVRSPGGVTVSGHAVDPDGGPVTVGITVGGALVGSLTADQSGAFSGFVSVPTATGTVCAVATNIGMGVDAGIGCSSLTVGHDPIGGLDVYTGNGTSVILKGWTLDPDTTDPIQVTVNYAGTDYGPFTANVSRPDVATAHPGYGAYHGYEITFTPPVLYGCNFAFQVKSLNVGGGTDSYPGGYFCS